MRTLVLIFLLTQSFSALCIQWHEGAVVLTTRAVLPGQIAQQSKDLILLKTDQGVKILPAHQVQSFRYFDTKENVNRKFISQGATEVGLNYFEFYEIILEGDVSVLRKQKYFHEELDEAATDNFNYFFLMESRIEPLRSFRKTFKRWENAKVIKSRKSLHLNPALPADAIQIIRTYNETCLTGSIAGI